MAAIRLLVHVDTAAGSGDAGDVVDWPGAAASLVDAGAAEWYAPEPADDPEEEA